MQRRYLRAYSPAVGRDMEVLAYGHYGPPLIAFPSGGGHFYDFEDNGMVDAVASLLDAGKLKLYCPDGLDHESWLRHDIDPHWRAVRHRAYEDYLIHDLLPFIRDDCHDRSIRVGLTGCSIGAFHAVNTALRHPETFHWALAMSGRYDLDAIMGVASGSEEVYFNNPLGYLYHLGGRALDRVRGGTHLVLVCGQGAWEDKCLADTHRLADLLGQKGISHERDIWGHDVEHHWYWWRKQLAHHLERALG